MPLHVQGLGTEQPNPRREPLWLIELDLVDDLDIKNKKSERPTIDWPVVSVEPSPLHLAYIPDSHLGYLSNNLDRLFGSRKVWDRHLSCFFLLPHI